MLSFILLCREITFICINHCMRVQLSVICHYPAITALSVICLYPAITALYLSAISSAYLYLYSKCHYVLSLNVIKMPVFNLGMVTM